jgi:hypothetical protein
MSSEATQSAVPADAEPAATSADPAAGAGGAPADDSAGILPARDRDILAFERQWWRFAGAKEAAIRERFGMTATRYYQVLNALVDRPEALATDPLLVRRLRRMRAARQRQRSSRVLGSDPARG